MVNKINDKRNRIKFEGKSKKDLSDKSVCSNESAKYEVNTSSIRDLSFDNQLRSPKSNTNLI